MSESEAVPEVEPKLENIIIDARPDVYAVVFSYFPDGGEEQLRSVYISKDKFETLTKAQILVHILKFANDLMADDTGKFSVFQFTANQADELISMGGRVGSYKVNAESNNADVPTVLAEQVNDLHV